MYSDHVEMKKGVKEEKSFRLYINNVHVGTVLNNNGVMSLDVRYGTYGYVSKSAHIFLEKLKNSFLLQMKVLGFLGDDIDTSKLEFEFGGTNVIAKRGMTLDEIENACYKNSKLLKESVYGRRILASKGW